MGLGVPQRCLEDSTGDMAVGANNLPGNRHLQGEASAKPGIYEQQQSLRVERLVCGAFTSLCDMCRYVMYYI